MRKYLYFRTVADEANDGVTGLKTSTPSSFLFPADSLTAIQPTDDAVLTLYFKPALANNVGGLRDQVALSVNEGDHYEVMSAITDAIASPSRGHSDGFIVIADDVTTTDSATTALNDLTVQAQYIHSSITACGEIKVQNPSTYGYHRHYEVVDIPTGAIADNDVFANLSIKIPAQAALVEASITAVELSGSADASCALEVHTASVASNAASAGTEIIGADEAGTKSLPNSDLNFGSGDVLGDTITGGTLISHSTPLDRGTSESFFQLCVKETSVNCTGTPKIGVYLAWYGPAAVRI
jgi:hypothetical protein